MPAELAAAAPRPEGEGPLPLGAGRDRVVAPDPAPVPGAAGPVLLALLLGLAALFLQQLALPVLTAEVPLRLGVAPLLVAFALLGPRLGLVAGLPLLLAAAVSPGPAGLTTAAVHVVEAWAASWMYERLRSLPAADMLFWCTAGAALDAVGFGLIHEQPLEAVALLYAGHVFGGAASAFVAEAALYAVARWGGRRTPAMTLGRFLSAAAMWLVVAPGLLLTLAFAALTYREQRGRAEQDARRAAVQAGQAVDAFVAERRRELEAMAEAAARSAAAAGRPVARIDVDRQRDAHPGFTSLVLRSAAAPAASTRVVQEPAREAPHLVLSAALPGEPFARLDGTVDASALAAVLDRQRPPEAETVLLGAPGALARAGRSGTGGGRRHAAEEAVASLGATVRVEQPLAAVQAGARRALLRLVAAFLVVVLLVHAATAALARTMAVPLARMDQAARALQAGRPVDPAPADELMRSPIAEIQGLAVQLAGLHESLAFHDALTGLPNQKLLLDRLSVAAAQAVDTRTSFALLLADLDRFRVIDSTLGHTLSNELLRKIARRLQECVRAGDTVARVGGDEFALLVARAGRMEDATELAMKVMDVVRRPFLLAGQDVFVTASVGISLYPRDGLDAETLLKNAMAAAYAAKEQGQDSYRRYTARIKVRDAQRLLIETGLRRALENDGLELHYQPMVDIRTGAVLAVEALVRWRRDEMGLVDAGTFIPVAEASGLITAIDLWVLRAACAQAAAWRSRGHQLVVAVNLSARQFQDPDVVEHIRHALDTAGVPPGLLEIEITEGVALRDVDRCAEVLSELRRLGVAISVDDFGTGYSSLSYLRRLPVDRVKLDRSFVQDITTNPDDAAIATAVIAMTHSLRLTVVAEGVETAEQLAFLRSHGCDAIQGRLFSRPGPAEEIEPLLAEGHRLL
jgi:diguanylate cyclase (GGDEF)-like protein